MGGRYINKRGEYDEFLLRGNPFSKDIDLDEITIEVHDDDGLMYFKRSNKRLLSDGYIVEVATNELVIDDINSVSDGFLGDLLKEPYTKMKKRVFLLMLPIILITHIYMK